MDEREAIELAAKTPLTVLQARAAPRRGRVRPTGAEVTEPLDLDAIRARADAAAPGPWTAPSYYDGYRILDASGTDVTGNVDYEVGGIPTAADAEFIAHARTDVPALLAEVERLTAQRDRLRATVALMFPVVEAVVARRAAAPGSGEYQRAADALDAAVDAYTAGQPGVDSGISEAEAPVLVDLTRVRGYVWRRPGEPDFQIDPVEVYVLVGGPDDFSSAVTCVTAEPFTVDPLGGHAVRYGPGVYGPPVRAAQDAASGRTDPAEGDPMPVFVIKAKDRLAPAAVEEYRRICENAGLTNQAVEVAKAASEIRAWQARHHERLQFPDHEHVPAAAAERKDLAPPA